MSVFLKRRPPPASNKFADTGKLTYGAYGCSEMVHREDVSCHSNVIHMSTGLAALKPYI